MRQVKEKKFKKRLKNLKKNKILPNNSQIKHDIKVFYN